MNAWADTTAEVHWVHGSAFDRLQANHAPLHIGAQFLAEDALPEFTGGALDQRASFCGDFTQALAPLVHGRRGHADGAGHLCLAADDAASPEDRGVEFGVHGANVAALHACCKAMLHAQFCSIASMKEHWTPEQEAENLAKRFKGVNQAAFAREFDIPGGASMVSQHIKGRRPINMDSALAYMRGFGVTLADISPRLAAQMGKALRELDEVKRAPAQEQRGPQAVVVTDPDEHDLLLAFRNFPDAVKQELVRDFLRLAIDYQSTDAVAIFEKHKLHRTVSAEKVAHNGPKPSEPPRPIDWDGKERRHHVVKVDTERRESLINRPSRPSEAGAGK